MDIKFDNRIIFTIIILPFTWGIYEFRLFRLELTRINNTIDKIIKNEIDNYPLLIDLKNIMDKIKKIINYRWSFNEPLCNDDNKYQNGTNT